MKCFVNMTYSSTFEEYMAFNNIDYESIDIWDDELKYDIIPEYLFDQQSLLVTQFKKIKSIKIIPDSVTRLIDFLNCGNHIIIWDDKDSYLEAEDQKDFLIELDKQIRKGSLTISCDGKPWDTNWLVNGTLKNINILQFEIGSFMIPSRILGGSVSKENASKDFLLTTVIKEKREHRSSLKSILDKRPDLTKNALVHYNVYDRSAWKGIKQSQHHWHDGVPSMDLYCDCFFEIVPETAYIQDGAFFTEKTAKPISTKTPFLSVATKHHLKYLKSLGFKTFDNLISEKYDHLENMYDRVKEIVTQVEYIIANGSKEFYQASTDILDHNYQQLAEIGGMQTNYFDSLVQQYLDSICF